MQNEHRMAAQSDTLMLFYMPARTDANSYSFKIIAKDGRRSRQRWWLRFWIDGYCVDDKEVKGLVRMSVSDKEWVKNQVIFYGTRLNLYGSLES